ncbi:hypothetical protein [Streptomyces sp. NPDC045470]|uniref:hypothetical protein n=1 Tax=Streptomyces sp. NPDC045470 TaxID=3155469 RepID=UPI0033C2F4C3
MTGTTIGWRGESIAATTLFDMDRRAPGDGKAAVLYARDKRHHGSGPKPELSKPVRRPVREDCSTPGDRDPDRPNFAVLHVNSGGNGTVGRTAMPRAVYRCKDHCAEAAGTAFACVSCPRPARTRKPHLMTADEFNALYAVGTPVIAYPGIRPQEELTGLACERIVTRTRTTAGPSSWSRTTVLTSP